MNLNRYNILAKHSAQGVVQDHDYNGESELNAALDERGLTTRDFTEIADDKLELRIGQLYIVVTLLKPKPQLPKSIQLGDIYAS